MILLFSRGGDDLPADKQKIVPDPERAVEEYGNSLYRLCIVILQNCDDAQPCPVSIQQA